MKRRTVPLLLAAAMALGVLAGCGKGGGDGAETFSPPVAPESTEPAVQYENPLTGLPIDEAWVDARPVAIMLNNLKAALPQQGNSQADIIYEVPAEGGITRMLAVYQTVEGVDTIGSIRSARPYYLELALGHDTIFIHAGGSEDAYTRISQWGVAALDGVRGPYLSNQENGNLMWRDPERKKSYSLEHTVVTTGEAIIQRFAGYTNLRQEHKEGYVYEMDFTEDGTPSGGFSADHLQVPFSHYKTGEFQYDPQSGLYLIEEYGEAYIDGDTGEQVGVTNVVVLKTSIRNTGDSLGHMTVDLSSGGTGYFACGGQAIDLLWSKDYPDGQLFYTDLEGDPITFGTGRTYVCIVPLDSQVSIS